MRIKIWGSRGSIPVSGKEYLKYGGDTTCLEIRTKSDDIIIVDAGTGIRRLGN
ncbi:MAG: MBL fold metallo-hydrolase, partial [Desulfobacterales bacterium]